MLSVVIPAYNEADRILPTLARMREYLDACGKPYELIVVDDGSDDVTQTVVAALEPDWPQLRVIRLPLNTGKGAAVRAGMLAARGDLRLFSDADLSTPVEELERLGEWIGGNCQVAIASRGMDRSLIERHQAWRREIMGKTYNRILRVVALPGMHDTQCGFKLFTAEAAVACFEPLRTLRFGFDAEVLLRARHRGWEVAEVPVRWRHVEASRVHALRDSSRMLWDLLLLRLRMRRI